MGEPLAFSVAEACSAARIGRTSLYEAIRCGRLRAVKHAKRTLILRRRPAPMARKPPSSRAQTMIENERPGRGLDHRAGASSIAQQRLERHDTTPPAISIPQPSRPIRLAFRAPAACSRSSRETHRASPRPLDLRSSNNCEARRARRRPMTRAVALTIRARIGNNDGPVVTVRGREAWAGERGCTPIDTPGPRWSGYVHDLRKLGIVIETIHEPHQGAFPGSHARYVLRSRVTRLEGRGAAA